MKITYPLKKTWMNSAVIKIVLKIALNTHNTKSIL
jgi:hypothetical protein